MHIHQHAVPRGDVESLTANEILERYLQHKDARAERFEVIAVDGDTAALVAVLEVERAQ